jgi:hypothetical protein
MFSFFKQLGVLLYAVYAHPYFSMEVCIVRGKYYYYYYFVIIT